MRILYVEDNPANLFLVQRVARMGNHEVINYTEGQTALDNFVRDNPDLVLMDVQLPGKLTGLDVVKSLREAGHKTPIIAVTAYAMMGDRERCLQVGCNAYIAKPLPVGELVEMIKQYEGLSRAEQVVPLTETKPEKPAETAPLLAPQPESKSEGIVGAAAPVKTENPANPVVDAPPVHPPEAKSVPEVQKSPEPVQLEKSADLESAVTASQNTPSTLSSKHQ